MQSDHDDIAQTFNAFRDMATAIALFSHKHPDVSHRIPFGCREQWLTPLLDTSSFAERRERLARWACCRAISPHITGL
jgi:hypothetical protein